MNETELLQAFTKERSEEAFAELVRRYAGLVYSVAKRRLPNAALAEDITQIVFIRFAKTPPKVKTHAELAAWLHRTTVHVTIDTWRSETRRRNREQQAVLMEPNTDTIWDDVSPKLDEALDRLNDDDRQAILLRFFGEKTMRDVGAAFGVSEDAAKMRVSRAVDRLRTQLGVGGVVCTIAVIDMVLTQHSAEAAPAQLVSHLAAMRLPPATGHGALFHQLQASGWKLAAGGLLLASLVVGIAHHLYSSSVPAPKAISKASTEIAREAGAGRLTTSPALPDLNPPITPATKPIKILFHVLDAETGTGLPQTQIRYVFFGPGGQGEGHDMLTDKNGDAPIPVPDDPEKNSGPNVFVTADHYVPKAVGWGGKPSPAEYTIRLDPAQTVAGVVVDEQGQPVSGVEILVQNPGNKDGQIENIDFQTCPVTNNEDGSWACNYIPKDYTNELRLILKKTGYATTFPIVPMQTLDLANLVLVINRGYTITGAITTEQGRPIANARLRVLSGERNKKQSTRSDEDGVFTFAGLPGDVESNASYIEPPLETNDSGRILIRGWIGKGPMHVDLAVQADGFSPQTKVVALPQATNVSDFALPLGNIFRGRVVDETGHPISNAVVQTDYTYDAGSERQYVWTAHTDANGRFEWDSAPAEKVSYWFEADGYEYLRDKPFPADDTDHEIILKGSTPK